MAAERFLVSGRVQGVCFRAGTRVQALRLALRGHARNLADGSVEVLAVGDAHAIEALAQWLEDGPPLAQVAKVSRRAVPEDEGVEGFEIL